MLSFRLWQKIPPARWEVQPFISLDPGDDKYWQRSFTLSC